MTQAKQRPVGRPPSKATVALRRYLAQEYGSDPVPDEDIPWLAKEFKTDTRVVAYVLSARDAPRPADPGAAPDIRADLRKRYPNKAIPYGGMALVAKLFGVSRERVRQIAEADGFVSVKVPGA